jgi:hypothetical protein
MRNPRRLAAAIVWTLAAVSAFAEQTVPLPADTRSSLILGEWILAGLLLVALYGAINISRNRPSRPRITAVEIPVADPAPPPAL